jgi:endogenous inhibitor of DNA gyrase (YacG/DUF329 family)
VIRPLTCPICQKDATPATEADAKWLPFCSERCRNIDLYRWSEGRYAIVEPLIPSEEEEIGSMEDPEHAD